MANFFQGSPPVWIIDTPSATPITTGDVTVDLVVWESGTSGAGGDECKITTNDATPATIYDVFGTGADFEEFPRKYPKNFHCSGLIVPTLAHGKVYIYPA